MGDSTRSRVVVGVTLTFLMTTLLVYLLVLDYQSGVMKFSLPLLGTFTYRLATNPAAFYGIAIVFFVSFGVVLAVCIATPFILRSKKRAPIFEQKYIELQDHFSPSGLKPLWIGLGIAVAAFVVYVVMA